MNESLAQFFLSGHVVDVAIAITLLEGLALAAYHSATGRGVAPANFAINMASGLCLMLALRAALTGSSWTMVALFLTASGAVHAVDIWRRWQR